MIEADQATEPPPSVREKDAATPPANPAATGHPEGRRWVIPNHEFSECLFKAGVQSDGRCPSLRKDTFIDLKYLQRL